MTVPETHAESVMQMVESSDLPAWAITSTKRYLRRALASAAADELDRQANDLQRKINSHGGGMRHGVRDAATGLRVCARCEAWGLVVSVLRARALELRKAE